MTISLTVGDTKTYNTVQLAVNAILAANSGTMTDDYDITVYPPNASFGTGNEYTGTNAVLDMPYGNITDAGFNVTIHPAAGMGWADNVAAGAQVKYDPTKGISFNSSSASASGFLWYFLTVGVGVVNIQGFQFQETTADKTGLQSDNFYGNLINMPTSDTSGSGIIMRGSTFAYNNIILTNALGLNRFGINIFTGSPTIKHNTVINFGTKQSGAKGISYGDAAATLNNNIVLGHTLAFASGGNTGDYNLCDDTSAPGAHSILSQTIGNVVKQGTSTGSTIDASLKAGSAAIAAVARDALVLTDGLGDNRTNPTAIGALEYAASGGLLRPKGMSGGTQSLSGGIDG